MESIEQFARELANRFSWFGDPLEAYLDDGDKSFSYVFFAVEVTPEIIDAFVATDEGIVAELDWRSVLYFIEGWHRQGNPDVDNVIKASFLLQLPRPGARGCKIVGELPERLATTFREVRPDG